MRMLALMVVLFFLAGCASVQERDSRCKVTAEATCDVLVIEEPK